MSQTLRFGVTLPHFRDGASASGIRDVAQAAERLGFDSLWVTDRVTIPRGPVQDRFGPTFYDPLATLSYLAGVTSRVKLGATVFVLPFHYPVKMARTLASIDQFSGGRLIVGVGSGWQQLEFETLGLPFNRRGRLTDEYLAAMIALWENPVASFSGPTVRFTELISGPPPAQQPRPPILVGGSSPAAMRRVLRFGDGWHGSPAPLSALKRSLVLLQEEAERQGRDLSTIALSARAPIAFRARTRPGDPDLGEVAPAGAPDEVIAAIHTYAAAGFSELVLDTFYQYSFPVYENASAAPEYIIRTLETFARAVLPAFRRPGQR